MNNHQAHVLFFVLYMIFLDHFVMILFLLINIQDQDKIYGMPLEGILISQQSCLWHSLSCFLRALSVLYEWRQPKQKKSPLWFDVTPLYSADKHCVGFLCP